MLRTTESSSTRLMKRWFKFSLLPALLCAAFAVQAVVSVDHIHLTEASEVDCSICLTVGDLSPANTSAFEVNQNEFRPAPARALAEAKAESIAPSSRGPPTQI